MTALVSLQSCSGYTQVDAVLSALLAPLGGLGAFVRPGQRVLLKPNLLMDATPEQAVTTHPEIVRAVLRAVRDLKGSFSFVVMSVDEPDTLVASPQVDRADADRHREQGRGHAAGSRSRAGRSSAATTASIRPQSCRPISPRSLPAIAPSRL